MDSQFKYTLFFLENTGRESNFPSIYTKEYHNLHFEISVSAVVTKYTVFRLIMCIPYSDIFSIDYCNE